MGFVMAEVLRQCAEHLQRIDRRAVRVAFAVADGGHPKFEQPHRGRQLRLLFERADEQSQFVQRLRPGLSEQSAAFGTNEPPPLARVVLRILLECVEVSVGLVGRRIEIESAGHEFGRVLKLFIERGRSDHGNTPGGGKGETNTQGYDTVYKSQVTKSTV